MLRNWLSNTLGTWRTTWRIHNITLKDNSGLGGSMSIRNASDSSDAGLITSAVRITGGTPAAGKVQVGTNSSGDSTWAFLFPQNFRDGLHVNKLDNGKVLVSPGAIEVNGIAVQLASPTVVDFASAGDWIAGSSEEAASTFMKVYVNQNGICKVSKRMPGWTSSLTSSRIATGQINGSPGLNGTSVVYDNDTGEGGIAAGMLLCVYTDSAMEQGRGRGSGAGGSYDNVSTALITAINTSTNTITLEAGHNINLTDNDYWAVIPYDDIRYYIASGTAWRLIGMIYNNASSNLNDDWIAGRNLVNITGSNYSQTSGTFSAIDATNLSLLIFTGVGDLHVKLSDSYITIGAGTNVYVDFQIDGIRVGATQGLALLQNGIIPNSAEWLQKRILPGTHTVVPVWAVSGGTAQIQPAATTTTLQLTAEFVPPYIR